MKFDPSKMGFIFYDPCQERIISSAAFMNNLWLSSLDLHSSNSMVEELRSHLRELIERCVAVSWDMHLSVRGKKSLLIFTDSDSLKRNMNQSIKEFLKLLDTLSFFQYFQFN